MKIKNLLYISVLLISFLSCDNNSSNKWPDLDLMKHGVPLKIHAPNGAVVEVNNMGVLKDITIQGDDNFALQIMAGEANDYDLAKLVASELETVKKSKFFSKIISQDDGGFIYEKKIDENINYDFRYFRIQGEYEFDFQRGLLGSFSLKEVQAMYNAVKK